MKTKLLLAALLVSVILNLWQVQQRGFARREAQAHEADVARQFAAGRSAYQELYVKYVGAVSDRTILTGQLANLKAGVTPEMSAPPGAR